MNEIMNDINNVSAVFVGLVDALASKQVAGKNLYALTKEGRYMNFRANDFKRVLFSMVNRDYYKHYMIIFRNLEWIICKEGRFTNAQFINGKTIRVISVDVTKYKQLKELLSSAPFTFDKF